MKWTCGTHLGFPAELTIKRSANRNQPHLLQLACNSPVPSWFVDKHQVVRVRRRVSACCAWLKPLRQPPSAPVTLQPSLHDASMPLFASRFAELITANSIRPALARTNKPRPSHIRTVIALSPALRSPSSSPKRKAESVSKATLNSGSLGGRISDAPDKANQITTSLAWAPAARPQATRSSDPRYIFGKNSTTPVVHIRIPSSGACDSCRQVTTDHRPAIRPSLES